MTAASLFEPQPGGAFVPTELARGPWDPSFLHGGPVAALAVRAVEGADGGEAMAVTRLTVELVRPVPVAPLTVAARVTRPGRKVRLVEVDIALDDGTVVTRATGLQVRVAPLPLPVGDGAAAPPQPAEAVPPDVVPGAADGPAFHNEGAELRFLAGEYAGQGPALVWVRLRVPVVPGEEPSPAARAVAAADFGNGVSSVLSWDDYRFINPDLTVSLFRQPVGEWVLLDAVTHPGADGIGLAESALSDQHGGFGRATQSLLLEPRG